MFKKSDLKTGMMIETVGGDKYIIMLGADKLGDIAYNIETKTYFDLNTYDQNMTGHNPDRKNWNAIKVYDGFSILRSFANRIEGRLLWERKEEKVFDMGDCFAKTRGDYLIFTDGFVEIVMDDDKINWFVDFLTKFFDGTGDRRRWHNDDCLTAHREGVELLVDEKGVLIDYPNARKFLTWLKENK